MGILEGKVAFITGAARGQGRTHAIRMAAEGADIIAVDLCEPLDTVPYAMPTEADLEETVQQVKALDRRIVARKADVRDQAALAAVVADATAELGRLDIVIANAGIAPLELTPASPARTWQDVIDINLTGVFNTVQVSVPTMIAGGVGGSIVLINSTAGPEGHAGDEDDRRLRLLRVQARHGRPDAGLRQRARRALDPGQHRAPRRRGHPDGRQPRDVRADGEPGPVGVDEPAAGRPPGHRRHQQRRAVAGLRCRPLRHRRHPAGGCRFHHQVTAKPPRGNSMSEPAASGDPTYPVVDFAPLDPRVHDDYWNALTELREKCPVGWTTSQWSMTQSGQWVINTHRDVMAAATDWQTYSSAEGVSRVQLPLDILRLIPVETDPPTHREVRKALNPFFTPYALGEKVGEIATVVDDLLADCLAQEGPVDFVASFTSKLPPVVFLGPAFLDSTEEQGRQLLELVDILLTKPELTMEAAPKLLAWCAELLESRRAAGRREDLAGVVAHMGFGENGLHLNEKERIETINLAVMAGMETTMGGLGATAWLLATRPELRTRLRDSDEKTVDRAIEEFLRFATPVSQLSRTLTKDTELGGCPMHKGDRVMLNWAAANLDPNQFPDPLEIDIDGPTSPRTWLRRGIHRCLGAHLARREIKAMVRADLRAGTFELAPSDAEIGLARVLRARAVAIPVLLAR